MLSILRQLHIDPKTSIFWTPVNHKIYSDYRTYITEPMDLGTIANEIKMSFYGSDHALFAKKVRLVWHNCRVYNKGTGFDVVASKLASVFDKFYNEWIVIPDRPEDPDISPAPIPEDNY
jgi:hypothetical protein